MVVRSRAAAALLVAASRGWVPTAPVTRRRCAHAICSSSAGAGHGVCLILSTSADAASVSLQQALLAQTRWDPLAPPAPDTQAWACGDARLWTLRDDFLRMDVIDERWRACTGQPATELIFLSRHASPTSGACLNVHPIGVAAHASAHDVLRGGGVPGRFPPPGLRLASLYRRLSSARKSGTLGPVPFPADFRVSLEATHHGPAVETPALFYEIGSSEQEWGRADAARLMTAALCVELEEVLTVAVAGVPVGAAPGLLNGMGPSALLESVGGGKSTPLARGSGAGREREEARAGAVAAAEGTGEGGKPSTLAREGVGAAPALPAGPVLMGVGGGHYAPSMAIWRGSRERGWGTSSPGTRYSLLPSPRHRHRPAPPIRVLRLFRRAPKRLAHPIR
jgi:D-aminoacyl-tRNA deacylase